MDILIGGAILGAIYSLVAVGLNLQYGVTRILNVAYGEFLMLGAYITYFSYTLFGVNPFLSLIISGSIIFALGILIQIGIFRRIIRVSKSAEELEFRSLLLCFGLSFAIQNVATVLWTANYRGYSPPLSGAVNIFGATFELNRIIIALISISVNLILYISLRRTKLGLTLRAIVDQPEGAQLIGINIHKFHALSFGLGVLLSAWTGTLVSMLYSLNPFMGTPYTMVALILIVIAGIGSFIGNIAGGFLLGYVSYITMRAVHSALTPVVMYVILILVLLIKPKGLFKR